MVNCDPWFSKFVFFFLCFTVLFSEHRSFAEETKKGGWLRERIKNRILEKQKSKPAPEASTDVSAKIKAPGDYVFTFKHGDLDRYYTVHVPAGYHEKTAWPLVLILHGGGGNMTIQATEKYYHQISKSDQAGYIAVFPNGFSQFKSGTLATWNAGKCCGASRDQKADDVGFIREMIQHLKKQLNIDANKIFADGMSNGAMMAYRLACEMSETFKAIAAVAGTDNTESCAPKSSVSILHIHAKDDNHVLFNGGSGPASVNKSAITDYVSVPNTISKWVKLNHCEGSPQKILEVKGAFCEKYFKCKDKSEVQLCVTETGGHSWPGGRKVREGAGKTPPTQAILANDVIWDFFKSK